MQKVLFLDRDGVINIDKNYLYKIEDFEFCDGIFEFCRYFIKKDYIIIVVTNQSGIARGYYNQNDFNTLSNWMIDKFQEQNIKISHIFHCPHHPNFMKCSCRKPNIGMIEKAKEIYNIDLVNSLLVGDKISDIECAKNSGIKNAILIEDIISINRIFGI
ncbi:D-glycero-D-manno-heptose 1,7-bisphosphate phosphatase [hydrothermal vent metagenome]|uniref:D,D-heptose 1,7-bisphosphate phosphatase n=2 Tax=hydrothermal vent metagenome TaxID=652676 RepID=A0A1W1EKS2_9ZZZZ